MGAHPHCLIEGHVPREDDGQDDHRPERHEHLARAADLAVGGKIDGQDEARQERRDRSFRQDAQPDAYVHQNQQQPAPGGIALRQSEEQQRQRHEHRDVDVDEDAAREHQQPRRHREPERRPPGGDGRLSSGRGRARQEERRHDQHDSPERDRDALDANRHAEQMIEAGDDPVAQDGLVHPRLVVEHGVDVVAALHHLARSFHVERFVGVPDGRTAQVDEIGADCQEQQDG